MTEKGLVLGKYPLNASLFLPPCAILIKKKKKKTKNKKDENDICWQTKKYGWEY